VANDLTISGGTVNISVIGGTTPAAGTFTTLQANTSLSVRETGGDTTETVSFVGPTSIASNFTINVPGTNGTLLLEGSSLNADDITSGTLADARLSSTVANLDVAETIAANWVNTANPWADDEVANDLTISGGTVNISVIGGTTPAAGTFTTIQGNTSLALRETGGDTTQTVSLVAPTSIASNFTLIVPGVNGSIITDQDVGTVTGTMITDLTVNTGDIANSAVTSAKIAPSTIVTGDISDGTILGGDLNSAIAIASTGAQNFGGASAFEIPNGATPTVDVNGEVAVDTTDGQIVYFSGAERVIAYEKTRCAVVEDLAAADLNFPLGSFGDGVTVTSVWCTCSGTCTTKADISLEDGGGVAMTHGTMTCSDFGTVPTAVSVTAANVLTARESAAFDVDNAVSPETDTYEICFAYTVDRQ